MLRKLLWRLMKCGPVGRNFRCDFALSEVSDERKVLGTLRRDRRDEA
jgi:hypothetical protein